MISEVLRALERGLLVMRLNSHLLLVGILVFVFPLLFVWITQSFFSTSYDNINTAEKNRIAILHENLKVVVENTSEYEPLVTEMFRVTAEENVDVTKLRLVKQTPDGYLIISSLNPKLVDTYIQSDELFRILPIATTEDAIISPAVIDGVRTWQVFRSVVRDGEQYITFSEHEFTVVDSVMSARRQQSYFGLTAIFAFLIVLAYWLHRQEYWKQHHDVLRKQLEERDMFSNMIAHEFRTPLTVIKGYASFLTESKEIRGDEKEYADNIRLSAERLVLLVNDFLEVARLQTGKMEIKKEEVDMRELLTQVTADLKTLAEEKNLSLRYEQPVHPIPFVTDKARMTQVLTNIITNAVKYTDSGAVELECTKEHRSVVIKVKDTGMGISAEDQAKLFAPFMRVGEVDKSKIVGSGLGMYITKQLVDMLDGSIGVESIKGVGTHIVMKFHE